MATRKLVPRADNEGGIGTALKQWASGWIKVLTVTTINALTPAAAAVGFTIAGGTTSKTLTVSGDATIGQAWTTPSYDANNFYSAGGQTWTVEAGDVTTYAYIIIGKTMTLNFAIVSSTVGGTPAAGLLLKIPEGKTIAKTLLFPIFAINGTGVISYGNAAAGNTYVTLQKNVAGDVWAASTNATQVHGLLTVEIN